jgi:hypothetical protein
MKFAHNLTSALVGVLVITSQIDFIGASSVSEVRKIAEEITVQVEQENQKSEGSGVIFSLKNENQKYTYFVLTNQHVVGNNDKLKITTHDKRIYSAKLNKIISKLDLAVLEFSSDRLYRSAQMPDSRLVELGSTLYIAGWDSGLAVNNRRTFQFTVGQLTSRIEQPQKGYSLVYNNPTVGGTSGGPILNEHGELLGINGQAQERQDIQTGSFFALGISVELFAGLRNDLRSVEAIAARTTQSLLNQSSSPGIDSRSRIEGIIEASKNACSPSSARPISSRTKSDFRANQARLLGLIARKSELECSAQFINQARLQLANTVASLFKLSNNGENLSSSTNLEIQAIQATDKALENQLLRIDSQYRAIQVEIEAVRKDIDQNIQNGFKPFG